MHLAVIDDNADVAGVTARQRTLFHALHNALQDGGHEACINGTAHNAVDEDELAAPFQVDGLLALCVDAELLIAKTINFLCRCAFNIWLNDEVNFAELTGTA